MPMYDYKEIDNKIEILNSRIKRAALQRNPVPRAVHSVLAVNSLSIQPEEEMAALIYVTTLAAEEIKEYVTQIWNDSQQREEMLEKLQDELNKNIQFLAEERTKLQGYVAEQKNILEKEKGLEESVQMVINRLRETEEKLQEVYEVYRKANKKGWKIIFYPALAFKAARYAEQNKDKILNEQREICIDAYRKLFSEQEAYLRQENELDGNIKNSMDAIAEAETMLTMQKIKLGHLKDMVVKGSNAFIYYSMLGEKIRSTQERLVLERDFCKNIERISVTQKELEELLEIWKQNKDDSETVYKILHRMFDVSKTKCYGEEIGNEFDDSSYIRSHFERIKGIHIQSGYIVDGIRVLYEDEINNQFHGKIGGNEYMIEFDMGDELQSVEGHYAVPYILPSGDAIGELYFITKKEKRYGPYGDCLKRGISFRIELPKNGHFLGFYGKSNQNEFITKLGLLYAEED